MPMPPPSPEMRAKLKQYIIDPASVPPDRAERGSMMDGKAVGGRPRGASAKHAFNLKRAKGPKSKFDSYHTGGQV